MATRGRKPKPTAQKVLEGNPGKRRLTVGEPRPGASQVRRMPRGLSPRAQELWHRLADDMADLGMFSDVDIPAFMLMAEHYAVARAALAIVTEDGMTVVDENGLARKHPLLQVFRDNSTAFRAYATEFGMTPSSRARLGARPEGEQLSLADELFGLMEQADEAAG